MPIRILSCFVAALLWQPASLLSQNLLGKAISFACENCPPAEALVKLTKETGVNIAFNPKFFQNCPPLTVNADAETLKKVLEKITACGRVSTQVIDNQIVLFRKTEKFRLAGYVEDGETGERLMGSVVKILPGGKVGTSANEFGFFSLILDEGTYDLAVSFVGFQTEFLRVNLAQNLLLKIYLRPNSTLKEVVISEKSLPSDSVRTPGNRQSLNLLGLKSIAMPGGEADVVRLAAMQPGVQSGVDGLGGLHVRGGNADQNLVLLDDVPVYNPSHALGLLSVFNPGAVSSAKLWKGNFPARYGGRAASVLDVRTRDGNFKNFHARGSVGLFASNLDLEGPLKKDKSSFLFGGRVTYFDPWTRLFSKRKNLLTFPDDNQVKYQFHDLNLKFNRVFSERDKIYLSFYTGGDQFKDLFEQQYFYPNGVFEDVYSLQSEWGNTIGAFRWNRLINKNLFTNTTLTYSRFFYESRLAFSSKFFQTNGKTQRLVEVAQLYKTLIRDFSAKSDLTYYLNNQFICRWGGSFTKHFFQPGALSVDLLRPGQNPSALDSLERVFLNSEKLQATSADAYAEIEMKFGKGWLLMAGANASVFANSEAAHTNFQPRINLRKDWKRGWAVWAGYHKLSQNLHQIGSYNISLPFELWVPSTARVLPEQVWQASGGFGWQRRGWSWQIEGYWKKLDRVLAFLAAYDALFAGGAENASGWEDRIAAGQGWSRGGEATFEKTFGMTTASLGYTLSWSWRQFPDINQGKAFPFRFDRRHDLKVNVNQKIGKWLEADATWVFATGNPITLTGVKFQHSSQAASSERTVFVYTDVNDFRLPNYHRLDVALNFYFKKKKFQHGLQIGLYNAYNRQNPFFLTVDAGSNIPGKAVQYTLLPLLPVFRYDLKF